MLCCLSWDLEQIIVFIRGFRTGSTTAPDRLSDVLVRICSAVLYRFSVRVDTSSGQSKFYVSLMAISACEAGGLATGD